ncbi:multidrug resistance efflux transporter family protein [Paraburkholderia silvatlantica]|uniref:Multidrug resistance efflux transporter n=1 Tax=Paraburkholderia silvatlantica TaxID=321895 RepID=A0ABR6FZV6_9BURK|nr:multidrug resistance efflux transporter family protein [Paraburkholderia silvatlantica]MBB2932280.1 hypothetical protein [Paraburkholderia silvatlantica]PVY23314.1 putative multidrug resistance efflux transporter [Paraburkholderia silvatlantica]PXW29873.1 putative multidrug resistance efflux transporter [Paraburkholderia silvatlantica]
MEQGTGNGEVCRLRAALLKEGNPILMAVALGVLAAALFSSTFFLNRFISTVGGRWQWTAALRFFYMVPVLASWITVRRGLPFLVRTGRLFATRPLFFLISGGIGYGVFYTGICFSARYSPGWVVASAWQITMLATPMVLWAFGHPVTRRGFGYLLLIASGVCLIQVTRLSAGAPPGEILLNSLPVVVAAFAYPIGNQMIWQFRRTNADAGTGEVLADPAACVLLLTLGALPVFGAVLLLGRAGLPGNSQLVSTALVALLSGCIATPLFLYARNLNQHPIGLMAVDATQAAEVPLALLGEMVFIGAAMPHIPEFSGIGIISIGLVLFARAGHPPGATE